MKINRNNYEEYFIDYLEGYLDEKLVDDFIEFIHQNPDLKEELSLFETITNEPETVEFSKKDKLYREKYDVESTFNQAAVARLEGDISEKDLKDFENYLTRHPEKQNEAALFGKTRLEADQTIVFEKKSRLYHRTIGQNFLYWSGRVAAVLILFLAVYTLMENNQPAIPEKNEIAVAENPVEKNSNTEKQKVPEISEKKNAPEQKEKKVLPDEKAKSDSQPSKSLRENNKGRMKEELLAESREPVEVPTLLNSREIHLTSNQPRPVLAPVPVSASAPAEVREIQDERLLADVVKEKTGINGISINKITKAGLSLISGISKDKFTYETDNEGKITGLNYDSRLLAFTIPTGTDRDQK